MKKLNTLLVAKKQALYVPFEKENEVQYNLDVVQAFLLEMKELGFQPSLELIMELAHLNRDNAEKFLKESIDTVKEAIGADVKHQLLFPDFPNGVAEMSIEDLYTKQYLHYIGYALMKITGNEKYIEVLSPENKEYEDEEKINELIKSVDEQFKLKKITSISLEEVGKVASNLLASKVALSVSDKELIEIVFENYEKYLNPTNIPFKETLVMFANMCLKAKKTNLLYSALKTPTDILRFAAIISDEDPTLTKQIRFKRFTTAERKMIKNLLNNVVNGTDDVHKHKTKIRLLFRVIQFGKKDAEKYPKANELANMAFDRVGYKTFNSAVEEHIESNIEKTLELLQKRPGEFLRKLNRLLTNAKNEKEQELIIQKFSEIAVDTSTPTLLKIREYMKKRNTKKQRYYFPRGDGSAIKKIPHFEKSLEENVREKVVNVIENSLKTKFSKLDSLGNVVLDEELKNFKLPMDLRTASDGLIPLTKGSKIPMEEKDYLRLFVHWIGRDIDLSAMLYNNNWQSVDHISFRNLKRDDLKAYHSGDIRYAPAPDGASEMIDFHLPTLKEKGIRYIVMALYVFEGVALSQMERGFVGWMQHNKSIKGLPFNPQAVVNKATLNTNSNSLNVALFDIEENKVVWLDTGSVTESAFGNEISHRNLEIKEIVELLTEEMDTPTVYDLLKLHAEVRGEIIEKGKKELFINENGEEEWKEVEINTDWTTESGIQFKIDELVGQLMQ